MKKLIPLWSMAAIGWGIMPAFAAAQATQTLKLSDALYFDCSVTEVGQQADPIALKLVYIVYADRPEDPVVNYFDPSKIVSPVGKVPGAFVLSQRVTGGPLFVWAGARVGDRGLHFHSAIRFALSNDEANRANVELESFARSEKDVTSLRKFAGTCAAYEGADPYYKYNGNGK